MEAEELIHRLARVHLRRRVEAHRRAQRPRRRSLLGRLRGRDEAPEAASAEPAEGADALLDELAAAENRGRLPPRIEAEAQTLLSRAGASLEGEPFEYLCAELLRVEHWARRIVEHEWVSVRAGRGRRAAAARPARAERPARQKPAKPLSEAIEDFVAWHEGKDWTPKIARAVRTALGRLLEIVGEKPLHHVTPEDVEHYRAVLARLPARMGVRYRGRSVAEVLAEEAEPGFSRSSIDGHLRHAHALFRFAEQRGWTEGWNPVRR